MGLKFNLILAKSQSNGIGYQGRLPWQLKKELSYFQRMTKSVEDPRKKNAVIMGRKTWEESMPDAYKPLPGRLNIVLSSQDIQLKEGAILCHNLDEVVRKLLQPPLSNEIETAWVIGGSKVYESVIACGLCHRIYLTEILADFPCDTFVNIDVSKGFKEVTDPAVSQEIQEENDIEYVFKIYEKIQ